MKALDLGDVALDDPDRAQVLDGVVRHLLDGRLRRRRRVRVVMAHPHEPLGAVAQRLERQTAARRRRARRRSRCAGARARERLVGERRQLLGAHPRIVDDPDEVEAVVARILRRPCDRPVLPRLDRVADRRQCAVLPGAGTGLRAPLLRSASCAQPSPVAAAPKGLCDRSHAVTPARPPHPRRPTPARAPPPRTARRAR